MRFTIRALGLASCFITWVALASGSDSTADTLAKLHHANMMEVECGRLAATRAEYSDVRSFGERLATDHGQAEAMVSELAKHKKITLPRDDMQPSGTDKGDDTESLPDRLKKQSGADFDREFLTAMIKDHEHDIKLVKDAEKNTKDAQLKALLAKLLPTLEAHRAMAQTLAGRHEK